MMAAMNNRTEVLKQLVKMDNAPLDFKQMKVRGGDKLECKYNIFGISLYNIIIAHYVVLQASH